MFEIVKHIGTYCDRLSNAATEISAPYNIRLEIVAMMSFFFGKHAIHGPPRGLFMFCEIDETFWELTVDCWNPAITTWNV